MANPTGWTYRVAFNLAKSGFRRRAAERRAHRRAITIDVVDDGETDRLAVRDALGGLPERQRTAVVLRYYGQLSVAETAAAMGCAEGTVRALTSQGVQRLRASFPIEGRVDEEVADHE